MLLRLLLLLLELLHPLLLFLKLFRRAALAGLHAERPVLHGVARLRRLRLFGRIVICG